MSPDDIPHQTRIADALLTLKAQLL